MAYCEDCGLSSCYVRGGYCEVSKSKARALVERLRPYTVKWLSGEWMHVRSAKQSYPEQDEWIEVVW